MLMLDSFNAPVLADGMAKDRAALVKSLDMAALWQSCLALISKALPCHSCSLLFDIDGYQPLQGRHHLTETGDNSACLVTSLDVAAPYLNANPQIRLYTFSQIASQDALAPERLRAQNPSPGWRDFIHLAFWDGTRLEAVLSVRLRLEHPELSHPEQFFLTDLYTLLDASLQRIRLLEADRVRHKAFEALIYDLPLAAVLVDGNLIPSYMSREAKRVCQRWSLDADRNGALPQALETPLRQWMNTVSTAPRAPDNRATFMLEHPRHPGERLRLDISSAPGNTSRHAQHLLILTIDSDDDGRLADVDSLRAFPLLQCLTPSERKVAVLVASGLRNDAIAQKLCRSRKTVECQIGSIFRKLNATNRTQLARMLTD